MVEEKIIVLPDSETMVARLLMVDKDEHIRRHFYPLLTRHAGEEKVPMGVVLMLVLAIFDYARIRPLAATSLRLRILDLIDALVEDKDAAAKTRQVAKSAIRD